MSPRPQARRPHYGRSRAFQTVRVTAWRSNDDEWHQVEDIDENKVGRYPTALSVERAKVIIVAGEIEVSNDDGVTWHRTGETKWITSHTPFTKGHTIDDFAKHAADYYRWRFV